MPGLFHISSTIFNSMLNRLGVRPMPPLGFDLMSTVQPVSLVDADISLPVIVTSMLLDVPSTAGEIVGPGANTVLADTGALPAGNYNIVVTMSTSSLVTSSNDMVLQRRNAANGANIWRQVILLSSTGSSYFVWSAQVRLALNERIRVITENAGTATDEANIWNQLVQ